MEEAVRAADDSVQQFKNRMIELHDELTSINRVLGQQDLLEIEARTRELLRRTKGLLEGNVSILFAGQPPRVAEDLQRHIDWAEGHLNKAFADEYDFETIKRRLYMATSLAEYVIRGVNRAVDNLDF